MLNIPFLSGTGKLSANFSITVFRVQRVSVHPLRITRSCLRQGGFLDLSRSVLANAMQFVASDVISS